MLRVRLRVRVKGVGEGHACAVAAAHVGERLLQPPRGTLRDALAERDHLQCKCKCKCRAHAHAHAHAACMQRTCSVACMVRGAHLYGVVVVVQ